MTEIHLFVIMITNSSLLSSCWVSCLHYYCRIYYSHSDYEYKLCLPTATVGLVVYIITVESITHIATTNISSVYLQLL